MKQIFVDEFQESQTRAMIFEGFQTFLAEFSNFTNISFDIWIDGNFVTKKLNPNDIDVVLIIDASILEHKGEEIEVLFKSSEVKQNKNITLMLTQLLNMRHRIQNIHFFK